jgi:hypothetical protein
MNRGGGGGGGGGHSAQQVLNTVRAVRQPRCTTPREATQLEENRWYQLITCYSQTHWHSQLVSLRHSTTRSLLSGAAARYTQVWRSHSCHIWTHHMACRTGCWQDTVIRRLRRTSCTAPAEEHIHSSDREGWKSNMRHNPRCTCNMLRRQQTQREKTAQATSTWLAALGRCKMQFEV